MAPSVAQNRRHGFLKRRQVPLVGRVGWKAQNGLAPMARASCADVLTDGGDPAGPEENATPSDDDSAAAGELDDEERRLRVTDLEYVREAEVEHLAPGRCATGDNEGPDPLRSPPLRQR